ncbi:MAG TPA: hypothetical protein VF765_38220 [Polyangiaceae bacterium]
MAEQKSHEETRSPRERLARIFTLIRRGLGYWKGTLAIGVLGAAVAIFVALHVKRVYRSEATILVKGGMRTGGDNDGPDTSMEAMTRQAARLKDMLTTRARLESAIRTFHLYPQTVATRTMLDAVEEMKPHVGFRSIEGAQYVVSFDGETQDQVYDVTKYLADSLIEDYAEGDLQDLKREADFLSQQEQGSLSGLEASTKALTEFLATHPEFAIEAQQAAATPFGPSPTAGIPLMPKSSKHAPAAAPMPSDPELAALWRERARLEGEARNASAAAHGLPPPLPASAKQADDQIAQAEAEVEAAAKRVAETQADLASKSNLTEDHPDMRAARMAAEAAARRLHESKVKLAALQQLKASGAPPPTPTDIPAELGDKLKSIDAQIAARRAQLDKSASAGGAEAEPPKHPGAAPVVELETEWQRLLRALSDARSHHDDLETRAERSRLALEAARVDATQRMAIVDPPFRPTHPAKGGRTNAAIAGLALTLLLALGYATLRVTVADELVDPDDIEALGIVPLLGVVPHIDPADEEKRNDRVAA